ncbi:MULTISPECIES: ABC transporter ATP-binding protein [Marinovum]|uniref:Carbohydrate ABC transporter ATP-binding protein, CUT1 family n=3 Tax=Marinovum algicola TaxID=42444 RepID=A0A975WDA3_9RHOB|nr:MULTISPECIES: sn-glycerol-3-phosphate ABC transporter ATP-binding protein UgpC [Marinovum]MDD9740951.1 sn-glycerol-3-phosphate ABC transporter ATP-binding protein UgpC [Marinovum sp. SP66]SEJ99706.1 carbohydrate ABC transporter ATP-binding protein, CUT1 family [Marinovum algicola]SLN73459.1 sn-glycerol-3-phosphate import ATP-binding protein UgpC [Marinovum algicola]
MATVTLENLKKSFGKTEVIQGIDIDIADGEFVVIVGPSGCGKSTLLRMVAGLETATSGEVRIDGKRVNDVEPMDRDIAMVFQNYALYPHMSVFDNMAYGLKIQKVAKPEIAERVQTAAKLLQLEPYLQRKPRELSGGQRQRVAMGRAIVRKPAVFLFDEPLSNLDAKLRVQMRLEIKALQRELGVTSLYVTHDQVEAMTLADRMIVMNAGVADQIGAPLDVYADPATEFVAGFIGSPPTNFIDAALLDGERAGRIGIRPEHVRLAEQGRIEAVVVYAEALGAETLVHLRAGDGQQITVRQESGLAIPTEGQSCGLAWDSAQVMRFDEAGLRQR